MPQTFNLTAQLSLSQPRNVPQVRSTIQQQLSGIVATVDIKLSPAAQNQLAQLNAQATQAASGLRGAQSAAAGASAGLQAMGVSATVSATGLSRLGGAGQATAAQLRQVAQASREAQAATGGLDRTIGSVNFALAAVGLGAFAAGMQNAVREAILFEREMVRLRQVGTSASEVRALSDEIGQLATGLGVSSRELSRTATVFRQAGLSIEDTRRAVGAVARASLAPDFGDMKSSAEGAVAIMAQFGQGARNLERDLSAVATVARSYAAESSDIIEAIKRTGGTFRAAGGDLNELIALFTVVRSTTRESAEEIATGLRTIFARLQRTETVESLRQLGIELRYTREEARQMGDLGLENQFVGPLRAIQRISAELSTVRQTDPRYAAISEEVGGYRQMSRTIPLLQGAAEAQKAYNLATFGSIPLTQTAAQAQDALLIRLTQLREKFLELVRSVTQDVGFRAFANSAITMAESLIKLTDALRPAIPLFGALAAAQLGRMFGGFLAGQVGAVNTNIQSAFGRTPQRYNVGGVVPGVGNTDSVPAYLMPGEFVIRKQAAEQIGYNRLHAMNGVQRFAAGGQVPALLALNDAQKALPERDSVRLLRLSAPYKRAATRYVGSRIAYLESDRPPQFDQAPRRTMEGILFERYISKFVGGFNPGAGLDFPSLSRRDRINLARITGTSYKDMLAIGGVELKRSASAGHLDETVRKAGFNLGGQVQHLARGGAVQPATDLGTLSRTNIASLEGFLTRLGLPPIRVSNLVSRLYAFNSAALPAQLGAGQGAFVRNTRQLLLTTRSSIPTGEIAAHELTHAADLKAGAGQYASALDGTLQRSVAAQALPLVFGSLLNPPTAQFYAARGADVALRESMAFSVQAFVRRLMAKKGLVSLQGEERRLFASRDMRQLLGRIGGELLPEISRLSQTPLGPLSPVERGDARFIDRLVARRALAVPGFARGGVVTNRNIQAILREFEAQTGIKFNKLVGDIRILKDGSESNISSKGAARLGFRNFRGLFLPRLNTIELNSKSIRDIDSLRETLAHELGHAVDLHLGGGKGYASLREGTRANLYATREVNLQRLYDKRAGKNIYAPAQQYTYQKYEGFANTFASHLLGDDTLRSRVNRLGFNSLLDEVASATNKRHQLGFFTRVRRFFGFNSGGAVPHMTRDEVLAAVSVGEGDQLAHNRRLARLAFRSDEALSHLPRGSSFLGGGLFGLAFRTPQGAVLRVQSTAGTALVRRHRRSLHDGLFGVYPVANVPEVLQPLAKAEVGSGLRKVYFGTYPFAEDVPENIQRPITNLLARRLASRGLDFLDDHGGNIGRVRVGRGYRYVVRDAGAVAPFEQATGRTGAGIDLDLDGSNSVTSTSRGGSLDHALAQAIGQPKRYYARGPGGRFMPFRPDFTRLFASGGSVEDNVPALLTPGEYVLRRDAVRRIGLANLNRMNATGKVDGVQAFNRGGVVRMATGGEPPLPIGGDDEYVLIGGRMYRRSDIENGAPPAPPPPPNRRARRRGRSDTYPVIYNDRPIPARRPDAETIPLVDTPPPPGSTYAVQMEEERREQRTRALGGYRVAGAGAVARVEGRNSAFSAYSNLERAMVAHAQVEDQLAAGIKRQLLTLNKGISVAEAEARAREMAARALQTNERVLLNRQGQVVGLAGLGTQLDARGLNAQGSQFAGLGRRLGTGLMNYGPTLLFTASAFVPDAIQRIGGNVQSTNTEAQNRTAARGETIAGAFSGAATGALTGSTLGSLAGPVGTAVGAVVGTAVGAVLGFSSAAKDAERKLNEIQFERLGRAVNRTVSELASGQAALTQANLGSAGQDIGALLTAARRRGVLNFDQDGGNFTEVVRDALQQGLQQHLGNVVQATNRDVERRAREAVRRGGTAEDASRAFLSSSFGGVALDALASGSGKTPEEVRRGLDDLARAAYRTAALQRDQADVTRRLTDDLRSFEALTKGIQSTANALQTFENRLGLTLSTFEGQTARTPAIGVSRDLSLLGAPDPARYLGALQQVSQTLGGQAGQSLFEQGRSLDTLTRVLPDIIRVAGEGRPLEGQERVSLVEEGIRRQVGILDSHREYVLSEIRAQTQGSRTDEGSRDFFRQEGARLSETVLRNLTEPLQQSMQAIAKSLEEEAARVIEAAAREQERVRRLITEQASLETLRVNLLRHTNQRVAESLGRPSADLLTLGQIQHPVVSQQERLTGLRGTDALDPAAVGRRFDASFAAAQAALRDRDSAPLAGPAYTEAARRLAQFQGEALRAQEALKNLADASQLNAGVQEKLARLEQERSERLSLGERILRGGSEVSARLTQGAALAQLAGRQGNVAGFAPQQIGVLFDFLDQLKNSRIGALGGITGEDFKAQLIRNTVPGIANLPGGLEGERQGLLGRVEENLNRAVEAQAEYIRVQTQLSQQASLLTLGNLNDQRGLQREFFSELQNINSQFLGGLYNAVTASEVNRLRTERIDVAARREQAQQSVTDANRLRGLGVTDANLETFRNAENLELFRRYGAAVRDRDGGVDTALRAAFRRLDTNFLGQDVMPETGTTGGWWRPETGTLRGRVQQNLGRVGIQLNEDELNEIVRSYASRAQNEVSVARTTFGGDDDQTRNFANDLLTRIIQDRLSIRRNSDARQRATDLEGQIGRRTGLGQQDLGRFLAELRTNGQGVIRALEATRGIETAAQELERITARLEGIDRSLQSLAAGRPGQARAAAGVVGAALSVNPLAALAAAAQAHADGGPIAGAPNGGRLVAFTPRGTDTVPAMLTEGEFVVRRDMATRYRGELEAINAGRFSGGGHVRYLANGGPAAPNAPAAINRRLNPRVEELVALMGNQGVPRQEALRRIELGLGGRVDLAARDLPPGFEQVAAVIRAFVRPPQQQPAPNAAPANPAAPANGENIFANLTGQQLDVVYQRGRVLAYQLLQTRRQQFNATLTNNQAALRGRAGNLRLRDQTQLANEASLRAFEATVGTLTAQANDDEGKRRFLGGLPQNLRGQLGLFSTRVERVFGNFDRMGLPELQNYYLGRVLPRLTRALPTAEAQARRLDAELGNAALFANDPDRRGQRATQLRRQQALAQQYLTFLRSFPADRAAVLGLNGQDGTAALREHVKRFNAGPGLPTDMAVLLPNVEGVRAGIQLEGQRVIDQSQVQRRQLEAAAARAQADHIAAFQAVDRFDEENGVRGDERGNLVGLDRLPEEARRQRRLLVAASQARWNEFRELQQRARQAGAVADRRNTRNLAGQVGAVFGGGLGGAVAVAPGFAKGGYVDGGHGKVDGVTARLSQGEFVLRPEAVQTLGVQNLQKFNDRPQGFARGGFVGAPAYYAAGGQVGAGPNLANNLAVPLQVPAQFYSVMTGFNSAATALGNGLAGFGSSSAALNAALNGFAGNASALAKALEAMPHTINFQGSHQHNHTFQGFEPLSGLNDALKPMVEEIVVNQIRNYHQQNFQDAGPMKT